MSDPTANRLDVLRSSIARLRALVEPLDGAQLRASAYPAEWSVADVLSHIGSSTVIMQAGIDESLAGRATDAGFAESVWDTWNAKSPEAQAGDTLVADRAFVDRLDALDAEERARVSVSLGPMMFGFDEVVGLRVNEHLVHTWDVAVTFDPAATLPAEGTATMIDNLGIVGRFWGKPIGVEHAVHVHTTAPERDFVIMLGMDTVTMEPTTPRARGRRRAARGGVHPPPLRASRPRPHARGGLGRARRAPPRLPRDLTAGYAGAVGVGVPELLIVLVVILVVFGGAKIPQLARSLGQAHTEFKKGAAHGLAGAPAPDAAAAPAAPPAPSAPAQPASAWPPASKAGPPEFN